MPKDERLEVAKYMFAISFFWHFGGAIVPITWARIVCFVLGVIFLLTGAYIGLGMGPFNDEHDEDDFW